MSDFPATLIAPQKSVLSSVGSSSLVADAIVYAANSAGSAVWPAANRAIYMPIWIEVESVATTIGFQVATQSGNLDVGIYDEKGNRIVSKGSTAVAAAGFQAVDLTTSVTGTASPVLAPGTYFMAMCCDNTTASFVRCIPATISQEVSGVQQQAVGAVTLPNPAVFANPATAYIPIVSLSTASTM